MIPRYLDGDEEALRLLRRVAQERDAEAFALLFECFQKPAFHLAYRILGNRAHAEEAVQESMLRVWRSAATFHYQGSVFSWTLRIVAHRSLRMAKRRQYERTRLAAPSIRKGSIERNLTASCLERKEQLSMLRRLLDELPELDRQLLAFHHEAGLSHGQISASLSIPRRTVSDRLKRALATLRAGMVRAGVAAA